MKVFVLIAILFALSIQAFESKKVFKCDGHAMKLHCDKDLKIVIKDAVYGRLKSDHCLGKTDKKLESKNCSRNVIDVVKNMCDEKSKCSFGVNATVFGDPCGKTVKKYITVTYGCEKTMELNTTKEFTLPQIKKLRKLRLQKLGNKVMKNLGLLKIVKERNCNGDTMKISCENEDLIYVRSAVYGRQANVSDCLPKTGSDSKKYQATKCSSKSTDYIRKKCSGLKSCEVMIDEQHFNNSCEKDVPVYMDVRFSCVPKSTRQKLQSSLQHDPDFVSYMKDTQMQGLNYNNYNMRPQVYSYGQGGYQSQAMSYAPNQGRAQPGGYSYGSGQGSVQPRAYPYGGGQGSVQPRVYPYGGGQGGVQPRVYPYSGGQVGGQAGGLPPRYTGSVNGDQYQSVAFNPQGSEVYNGRQVQFGGNVPANAKRYMIPVTPDAVNWDRQRLMQYVFDKMLPHWENYAA